MNLPPEAASLDTLLDRALNTGGETTDFDFKEELDFLKNGEHKLRLLRAVGAFGNTDKGGHIIIGITDDRQIVGMDPALAATYDQTPVQTLVAQYLAPPPSIQVRQHLRDGKSLVFIEVRPFDEIPSIVRRSEVQGKEKLQAGTFLVRNGAAESALLTSEAELRKLCDAIAARRAGAVVRLFNAASDDGSTPQRGDVARQQASVLNGLKVLRAEAERIREHAQQLNAGIANGYAKDYLPLLFRPALLESTVPLVIDHIQNNTILRTELASLRTAAAAADEETTRYLGGGGGVGDQSRLIRLVLSVLNSARHVVREIDGLLNYPSPHAP